MEPCCVCCRKKRELRAQQPAFFPGYSVLGMDLDLDPA